MRTKTFSEEDKKEIKEKMIQAGLPLLREYGMTHMSIVRLTQAAGIGKSTFYNFYASKEEFVEEMLAWQRRKLLEEWKHTMDGRGKLPVYQAKEAIRGMIDGLEKMYGNFTAEDERKLYKSMKDRGKAPVDLSHEVEIMKEVFSIMEGVQEKIDYAVVSNLIKLWVIGCEERYLMHEEGYEGMKECILQNIFELVFQKDFESK